MAESWFVTPEPFRLELEGGQWMIVRKRLNTGEQRKMFARQVKSMVAGEKLEYNPVQVGLSQVVAYLLDWSLTGPDGKPVIIRGLTPEALEKLLEDLDPDRFTVIWNAIQAHEAAMTAAREQEKKVSDGSIASEVISGSVA